MCAGHPAAAWLASASGPPGWSRDRSVMPGLSPGEMGCGMPSRVGRWLAPCLWYGSPGPARGASQESETDLSKELPRVEMVPAYRCPAAEPWRTVFATPSSHVHLEEPQLSHRLPN